MLYFTTWYALLHDVVLERPKLLSKLGRDAFDALCLRGVILPSSFNGAIKTGSFH
jgi:hypothetical protein